MVLGVHPQAVKQVGCVGLGLPAVHLGEFRFQVRGPDAVGIAEVFLHIDGILLLHHVVQMLVAHNNRVQYLVFIVFKMVLLQKGQPLARSDHHIPGGGL